MDKERTIQDAAKDAYLTEGISEDVKKALYDLVCEIGKNSLRVNMLVVGDGIMRFHGDANSLRIILGLKEIIYGTLGVDKENISMLDAAMEECVKSLGEIYGSESKKGAD